VESLKDYISWWDGWYRAGNTSGPGSYGVLAKFKADVVNAFIERHEVKTVVEFGCGDGNQLGYMKYPQYIGLDVSETAIKMCRDKFNGDKTKQFMLYVPGDIDVPCADLVVCLDVLYHITDDEDYAKTISDILRCGHKNIIIYTVLSEMYGNNPGQIFSRGDILNYLTGYDVEIVPQRYKGISAADFIIARRI
jgi:SAM-dependent methyltransferase